MSGEFVGTFCYYYLLLLLLLSLCVCVYPCKQFVVVTIRRTGSWNTIPTLPYLTRLFFYRTLTRSTGIHHRFIVWFLERTIILEDNTKVPLGTNFQTCPRTHWNQLPFKSNSGSTVAALLNDIFTLVVVVVVVVVIIRKQREPNRTEYINLQGGSSLFFNDQHSPFLHQYRSIKTRQEKKGRRRKENNINNIKTMTHHRMGFTPSSTSSTSSSSSTTKPSAITTKQRACLGGMVITPCEKCTIRTYVSLSLSHPT